MQAVVSIVAAAGATALALASPAPAGTPRNRLVAEDSTYLRTLAGSAVDWHPWGPQAFAEAERTGRPVFVSIGYASCVWSSRMDRTTFQDPGVAALLNTEFVNVKLDRFERPDLDRLYQRHVESTGQRGGWPLNIWLTPEGWPLRAADSLTDRGEGPESFILEARQLLKYWTSGATQMRARARLELDALAARTGPALAGPLEIDHSLTAGIQAQVLGQFDPVHGGFGGVPKFPAPARIAFLAVRAARDEGATDGAGTVRLVVRSTLDALARSGLRDHLGGGFFRYALDEAWRRPFFEKAALDQALHADSFLLGHRLTREARYAEIARETLDYAVRELGHPEGGFYAGEHGESLSPTNETMEGAYYVWSESEIRRAAGDTADLLVDFFGIQKRGNVAPGSDVLGTLGEANVLAEARSLTEAAARLGLSLGSARAALSRGLDSLLTARHRRPRPAVDRLITTQMNAALVGSLARAGVQLEAPGFLERARRAADFLLSELWDPERGHLYRCRLDRDPRHVAVAEDHAFLVRALLDLHEATGECRWLREAADIQAAYDRHHTPTVGGGYFDARLDGPDVPVALMSIDDAAWLSPNAVAGQNLVRWAGLMGTPEPAEKARRLLRAFASPLRAGSGSVAGLGGVADSLLHPPRRIILVGPAGDPEARAARTLLAKAPPGHWHVLTVENEEARRWLVEAASLPPAVAAHPLDRPGLFLDDDPAGQENSLLMQALPAVLDASRHSRLSPVSPGNPPSETLPSVPPMESPVLPAGR